MITLSWTKYANYIQTPYILRAFERFDSAKDHACDTELLNPNYLIRLIIYLNYVHPYVQ